MYTQARLAQSAERTTFNRVVVGSIPTSGETGRRWPKHYSNGHVFDSRRVLLEALVAQW